FGVAGAGGRFAIVFGKLQRVGKKKGVEAGCSAGEAVNGVETREAFFFRPQMKLGKQRAIFQCGGDYALAESGDSFSNDANALLLFGREEKGAQEGAMDAISEGELGFAQAREKLIGEAWCIGEHKQQLFAPMFGGFGGRRVGNGGAVHLALAPEAEDEDVVTWREAVFGAAVNPEA